MASTGPATVDYKLPAYKAHIAQIQTVNTIYDGIDTAKTTINPLPNEYEDSFDTRVKEATLDNFVERIVTTMAGMIMRKPLVYDDVPEAIEDAMNKVSGNSNLDQFTKACIEYGIRDGKSFILVDAPVNGGNPYFTHIKRANLINWRKNEEGEFIFAVIYETYEESDGGQFGIEVKEQYRVINEMGNVDIWRNVGKAWEIYETINTSYNFCPLYELDIADVPPLYDIAKINIKQLNFSSLRDRFLKEAIDPMLFGKGLNMNDEEGESQVVIGVNQMMNTDNTDADLSWVELDGSNYNIAESYINALDESMEQRAFQLQNDSIKVKTATQVASENAEGSSRLSDIAEDTEIMLMQAVNAWSNIKNGAELVGTIKVNRDFNISQNAGLLTELNTLQVSGNLSRKTLLESAVKTEIIAIDSIDEELDRIEEEQQGMELIQPEPIEETEEVE